MKDVFSIILITLLVLFVIYLILRELNTWYWKINERITLQYKVINNLRQILVELKKLSQHDHNSSHNDSLDDSPSLEKNKIKNDENQKNNEFEFTNVEKELIRQYIKSGLKKNERLIINKNTRQIKKIDNNEWAEFNKNDWIFIDIK